MNYLSFDVGINNLAYCVLTPGKKIVDWGILNLNEKLGVISAEVYNSDLQTLFVKIDTIEFYKVLLTIVIVFFLSTIFVKNTHLYIRAYENTK